MPEADATKTEALAITTSRHFLSWMAARGAEARYRLLIIDIQSGNTLAGAPRSIGFEAGLAGLQYGRESFGMNGRLV